MRKNSENPAFVTGGTKPARKANAVAWLPLLSGSEQARSLAAGLMRWKSGGKEKPRAPMGTVLFGATVSMKLALPRPAPKRTVPFGAVRPSQEQTHPLQQKCRKTRRLQAEQIRWKSERRRMASPMRGSCHEVTDEVEERLIIAVGRRCFFSTSSVTVSLSATRRHLPHRGRHALRSGAGEGFQARSLARSD